MEITKIVTNRIRNALRAYYIVLSSYFSAFMGNRGASPASTYRHVSHAGIYVRTTTSRWTIKGKSRVADAGPAPKKSSATVVCPTGTSPNLRANFFRTFLSDF